MSWTKHDYEDIPGTYVFDGKHAYGAYPLNKLLFSFCEEANRTEFDRDPAAYCDKAIPTTRIGIATASCNCWRRRSCCWMADPPVAFHSSNDRPATISIT